MVHHVSMPALAREEMSNGNILKYTYYFNQDILMFETLSTSILNME